MKKRHIVISPIYYIYITYVPISLSITSWTKVIESCGNYIDWAVRSICYHINNMLFYFWRFRLFCFLEVLGIVWASLEFACGLLRIRRVRGFSINFKQRSRGDRGWQTVSECFPIFPHIFVWGSCFWLCTSASPLPLPPAPAAFLTHTARPHTTYSHTQLVHAQLVTTQLAHTQLAHTQHVHTQLYSHTQLVPTQLTHTQHLATWTCILRGRRGTYRTGLALVARLGPVGRRGRRRRLRGRHGTSRHRPSLCMAGVALRDIDLHFAWQAWHLATWTCILRGRRGTYRTWLALVARLGPVGRRGRRLHGRRGTSRHRPSLCVASERAFCVAGVALIVLGWLWWRAWAPLGAVVAAAVCVAGMALRDIDLHFAWQAWHLWHLQLVHLLLQQLMHIHTAHIHACTHTHTHAVSCTILSHTHTHHFYALLHTLLSRTSLRHTFVAHADPSPSLISFLHFPSHLYLSFAAYWTTLEEVDMWGYPVL